MMSRYLPDDVNPLYNLGGLCFYLFWIVAVSGLYLFIFFETSITGAYQSVEVLSNEQFYVGSIMRGLHRYASAAMALGVTIHLFKELVMKHYQGVRWFSWVSGVPLLWLLFASAIGGYWLVWDERAQYIALTTARLFDSLPIVVEPMAFGFINDDTVSDRFFTLLIFLHVGVPLGLLLGMFIHIQRISQSKSFPPRPLAIITLVCLTALSLIKPVSSMAPANLDKAVHTVEIDWFYMNFYPLINQNGPGIVWLMLLGVTAALILVPVLHRGKKKPIAVVDPEFCNGCGWCFADCPYDAISMKPHDYKKNHNQSVVIADKCVGCGICAGACPTATPFKSVNKAHSGINLSDKNNSQILIETQDILHGLRNPEHQPHILVVGCDHGPDVSQFSSDSVASVSMECIGQLPPSYLDFLGRKENVDAVLLTGCSSGNCYHRLGIELQEARLAHEREPHLRFQDVQVKVNKLWVGRGNEAAIAERIAVLQQDLSASKDALRETS
jgi:quinol-cytochrome oxidoreductase complex cytochrome b subunit/coenzyme F420-reducing hydrogenase delta subunit